MTTYNRVIGCLQMDDRPVTGDSIPTLGRFITLTSHLESFPYSIMLASFLCGIIMQAMSQIKLKMQSP